LPITGVISEYFENNFLGVMHKTNLDVQNKTKTKSIGKEK